jgi:protein SCO1/2
VLLTISFDPVHDTPEKLAEYAGIWRANPARWHFLTGAAKDVERVSGLFGVAAWKDDGLLTHSLHTAIIGRDGKLVANLEGNRFTAQQLGDLVEKTLAR